MGWWWGDGVFVWGVFGGTRWRPPTPPHQNQSGIQPPPHTHKWEVRFSWDATRTPPKHSRYNQTPANPTTKPPNTHQLEVRFSWDTTSTYVSG